MNIIQSQLKKDLPEIRPGDTVVVYQKIPASAKTLAGKKEEDKERIQAFEGLVLARKHGKGINAAITVRKMVQGVGVEKIYPLHSPTIERIEVLRHSKVRRAKLYYIREKAAKEARKRLKQTNISLSKEQNTDKEEPGEEKIGGEQK